MTLIAGGFELESAKEPKRDRDWDPELMTLFSQWDKESLLDQRCGLTGRNWATLAIPLGRSPGPQKAALPSLAWLK